MRPDRPSPTIRLDHTGHAAAGVGRLDFKEWSRLLWAIGEADAIVAWLFEAGNTSPAVDPDVRVHTTTAPSINLPATWLAAEEIQRHWVKVDEFRTLELCANDALGAYCAIEFGRAVSTADRRWPREEHPHAMQAMRCGGCEELTLIYRPPRFPGDRISIDCPNADTPSMRMVSPLPHSLLRLSVRGQNGASGGDLPGEAASRQDVRRGAAPGVVLGSVCEALGVFCARLGG